MDKGAPFRLNIIMSCNRFDFILSALCFTNREVPCEDGFLQMRQLEEAWNQNMDQQFLPSWINVIDEYMKWSNKWAPGFLCVGRKPHPFGNEWHTFCCALTTILWRAQIVEGKDRPTELGKKKWEELGKTVGLMLQICEPIFSTGKCVVLDSDFCVSKGITALLEFGFYAAALIKKRKYWLKGVLGDTIDEYFADKDITHVDMLEAITEEGPEGKAFNIFCFKEPEYVMKIMAT